MSNSINPFLEHADEINNLRHRVDEVCSKFQILKESISYMANSEEKIQKIQYFQSAFIDSMNYLDDLQMILLKTNDEMLRIAGEMASFLREQ